MAHIIVLESWVEGTGRILPKTIRSLGYQYTFVTRNPEHYSNQEETHEIITCAEEVITTETNDFETVKKILKQKQLETNYDGILTICDYYISMVSRLASELGLPQAFSSNAHNECDKLYVRNTLAKAEINGPNFAAVDNAEDAIKEAKNIGYPIVVKPSDLASSAFVRLAETEEQLLEAVKEIQNFTLNFREQKRDMICLLEERIEGPEYSVEAYTYKDETTIIGITDKSLTGYPYFIEDGHMFPANISSSLALQISSYVKQVLQALKHDNGISHTEVKVTPDGIKLIETNPRPGGNFIAELIKLVTNIDILKLHIDLSLGKNPEVEGINSQGSAAVQFIVPKKVGTIVNLIAPKTYDPQIINRYQFKDCSNLKISKAIDNSCYLGHVIALDKKGHRAREFAENFIAETVIKYQ